MTTSNMYDQPIEDGRKKDISKVVSKSMHCFLYFFQGISLISIIKKLFQTNLISKQYKICLPVII